MCVNHGRPDGNTRTMYIFLWDFDHSRMYIYLRMHNIAIILTKPIINPVRL